MIKHSWFTIILSAALLTALGAIGFFIFSLTRKPYDVASTALQDVDVQTIDFTQSIPIVHSALYPLAGVISGPTQPVDSPAPDLTQRYQEIGVTSVRNNDYYDDRLDIEGIFNCGGSTYPSWEGCNATDDQFYSWTTSDELVESIKDGGFDLFLRLGGEWENQDPHHDFKGPQNPTQIENWITAAKKVATRYESALGDNINIWTEYPGEQFWDGTAQQFNAFFARAYTSIKAAFPEKHIGGPGFAAGTSVPISEGELTSTAYTFLKTLYNENVAPDWIGWHLFSSDPETFALAGNGWRDVLDGTGSFSDVPWAGTGFFKNTELICDAYGLSSGTLENGELVTVSDKEADELHNGGKGATLQTAAWIALQSTDTTQAFYYRGGDPKSSPNGNGKASGNVGLFYGDESATPKPSANAFKLRTTFANNYSTITAILSPEETALNGIWALTAEDSHGKEAILFANTSSTDVFIESPFASGTIYVVNDDDTGKSGTPVQHNRILLPKESSVLVRSK